MSESIDIEKMINSWKDLYGNKKFYVKGGWTEYPNTQHEKHYPMEIVKGILKKSRCHVCNEDLEEPRIEDPKDRSIKYCSGDCYNEAKELYKIKKKLNAVMMTWSHSKPPIDKSTINYTMPEDGWVKVGNIGWKPIARVIKWRKYKARKPKDKKLNL
ncbi:MAG: hypothetical protein FJ356_03100 [Thaumarchaeota archaeon]|nr:hypothetical protein [Nitrososphaerota archaeon]